LKLANEPSAVPDLAAQTRFKLYRETSDIVDRLTTSKGPINDQSSAFARFWELYRVELIGIESDEVARKMVAFGRLLKDLAEKYSLPNDDLRQLRDELRQQIEKELSAYAQKTSP